MVGYRKRSAWILALIAILALIGLLYRSRRFMPEEPPGLPMTGNSDRNESGAGGAASPSRTTRTEADLAPTYITTGQYRHHPENAGKFTIRGRVFSGGHSPIPEATVSLFGSRNEITRRFDNLLATVSTDASGSYEIALNSPAGGYLAASRYGFAASESAVSFDESDSLIRDFILEEGSATVSGRVTDLGENPIEGALVSLSVGGILNVAKTDRVSVPVSSTDHDGRYEISSIPEGRREVFAFHEEYGRVQYRAIDVRDGDSYEIDFRLPKADVALARVVDPAGRPVESAQVLWDAGKEDAGIALTRSDGIAKVQVRAGHSSEPVRCQVRAAGFVDRTALIGPGEQVTEIALKRADAVIGAVSTPDGRPVARARILIRTRGAFESGLTDESGGFAVAIAQPPATEIQASKAGYVGASFLLDPKSMPGFKKITLKPAEAGGGIYGKVVTAEGRPVYSFVFRITPGSIRRYFSSLDGTFEVSDLPEGTYSFTVRCLEEGKVNLQGNLDRVDVRKGMVYGPVVVRLR